MRRPIRTRHGTNNRTPCGSRYIVSMRVRQHCWICVMCVTASVSMSFTSSGQRLAIKAYVCQPYKYDKQCISNHSTSSSQTGDLSMVQACQSASWVHDDCDAPNVNVKVLTVAGWSLSRAASCCSYESTLRRFRVACLVTVALHGCSATLRSQQGSSMLHIVAR